MTTDLPNKLTVFVLFSCSICILIIRIFYNLKMTRNLCQNNVTFWTPTSAHAGR